MSSSKFCVQVSPEIRRLIKSKAVERGATMGQVIEALAIKHLSDLSHGDIHKIN